MLLATISPTSLLLVFLIIALLFGTNRLRNIGTDLGAAFRNFRKGMAEEENKQETAQITQEQPNKSDHHLNQ